MITGGVLSAESDRINQHQKDRSAAGRDIGPPRRNEPYRDELRDECDKSLQRFLEICFPQAFPLEWSPDHIQVIEILQSVATKGGLFALAMPRGSGKTSITARAAIWALLTKRRRFVEIIAGTERLAKKIIKAIKTELSQNQELELIYPLEMHGFWQLNGDNRRAGGQHCSGEKTGINLGINEIIFPTHKYSPIGGAVVYATGLTGNVRGSTSTGQDGTIIRPDFVILDDPQTRESSTSAAQTEERIEIIQGDVLGLAGPGQSIAAVMPCTVVSKDDLADHFLKHPRWQSIRTKMLPSFPTDMTIWDRYFEVRGEEFRVHGTHDAANEFYILNREAMDDGAVASWEARKEPEEVSAIQSAMHLWHRDPPAFAAEYNNEPLDASQSLDVPTFTGIQKKTTNLPSLTAPVWATKVTLGIDVQQRCLFWLLAAWADDFTGSVIGYGAWPQQSRSYFDLAGVNPTLQQASGFSQLESSLRWGLDGISEAMLGNPVAREGGGEIAIGKALIDANWGQSTDTVYEFCRRTPFAGIITPSHGRGIKAGDNPMAAWPKKQGETHGWNWIHTPGTGQRAVRHAIFDSNFWKTTMAERAAAAVGEKGSLSLFGDKPEQHKMFFDHLAAESPTRTSGRGREVWEWKARPGVDNHWLDCLSLAGVAASILGCAVNGMKTQQKELRVFSLPGRR